MPLPKNVCAAAWKLQAWAFIGDIGAAIAPFARKHGYSVVTEFGGHGVGVDFHEEPFVCHDSKKKYRHADGARYGIYG